MPAAPPGALRPLLPADAPVLAALFRAAVSELAADDYGADQLDAWASAAEDEVAFARELAACLTLVALVSGEVAGFASLKGQDRIDKLYVAPDRARQGVATALVDALVRLAAARGAARLTVDASDTAQPLFAKLGFAAVTRNTVPVAGEWLGNTTMERKLAGGEPHA